MLAFLMLLQGADLDALRRKPFAEAEAALRAWTGELKAAKGTLVERSATTPDGETFTYGLWVPPDYTPEKAWPLLLTLHGTNRTDDPAAGPRWMSTWLRCAALKEACIVVAPTTVRWTWGNLKAHARIVRALDEVRAECRVDPDRVYADGMSMGAGGAWNLGEHYPDRWAAIAPRCGAPHLRRRKDQSLLVMLGENFRNLPVYHVAGAQDKLVPVDYARAGRDALKAFGYEQVYKEHPEGGHDWGLEKDEDVVAWLLSKARRAYPEEVVFKTYEKAFARAYWVEVVRRSEVRGQPAVHMDIHGKEAERRTEFFPEAVVRAKRSGQAIEVTTSEVKELRLWLSDAMLDLDKPVVVTWNGRKVHDKAVRRSVDVLLDDFKQRRDPGMTFGASLLIK
jgi:poly(3-hydroxybutyrate) depolymerase